MHVPGLGEVRPVPHDSLRQQSFGSTVDAGRKRLQSLLGQRCPHHVDHLLSGHSGRPARRIGVRLGGRLVQLVQVSGDAEPRVAGVERRHGDDRCDDERVAEQRRQRLATEGGTAVLTDAVPSGRRRVTPVAVLVNDDIVDALAVIVVNVLQRRHKVNVPAIFTNIPPLK